MESFDYLLAFFPEKYRGMIIKCDFDLVPQFMEDGVKNPCLAHYLSMIANLKDTAEYHCLAGFLYHFHFNWADDAYLMAFYHYWRELELENFSNYRTLNDFLKISEEPDFDIIPRENLDFVKDKLQELKHSKVTRI